MYYMSMVARSSGQWIDSNQAYELDPLYEIHPEWRGTYATLLKCKHYIYVRIKGK